MQKLKTIALLFVLALMLFPWRLLCFTHPLGHSHEHHEPGKLSPCELRKQYKGNGPAIFPPMHCHYSSLETDNFQTTEKYPVKPAYHTLALAVVLFEIIKKDYPQQPFLFPPEPKCRSAAIISANILRGPPVC